MDRAICEQCGRPQPRDWVPGDLCVACGSVVRREVRCAWCAQWTPAVRFCRTCGCEVVSSELYGAARMLKSAGVDRFSLAPRLRALDPEQVDNFGRMYNAQLAVVTRRVDEVRLCETFLLQKEFSHRLDEELVPRLPLEPDALAALAAGPEGPFEGRPELLPEIAQRSPLSITRLLASIALLRQGVFEDTFASARTALEGGDPALALEAALAFAHWRVRLCPRPLWRRGDWWSGIDPRKLLEVAGAVSHGLPLRAWAAAAVSLATYGEFGPLPEPGVDDEEPDWLRPALSEGLASGDSDLRFTCAMALGQMQTIASALDAGDEPQSVVARRYLTRNKSPAIVRLLVEGPEEVRADIIKRLRPPLPDELAKAVLEAAERCGPELRGDAVRLLLPTLTEAAQDRLIRLARRERDKEIYQELARCETLPAGARVVRAVIQDGLFGELGWTLRPAHFDFTDEAVAHLVDEGSPPVLRKLIMIAGNQLRERLLVPTGRFLARIAFGAGPADIRDEAYRELEGVWRDWMSPQSLPELFGSPAGFLKAIAPVLAEAARHEAYSSLLDELSERWPDLADDFMADPATLKEFIAALGQAARGDVSGDPGLQLGVARFLARAAMTLPEAGAPVIASLLRDCRSGWQCEIVPHELLAEYKPVAPHPAAELADALAEMLAAVAEPDYRYEPAAELLKKLAGDATPP